MVNLRWRMKHAVVFAILANAWISTGVNVSTAQLARVLTTFIGHPVIDETGLHSIFDFKMDFVLDLPGQEPAQGADGGPSQSIGPSVFTSLQEQLGLKLVPKKDPVQILVIAEGEPPAPN